MSLEVDKGCIPPDDFLGIEKVGKSPGEIEQEWFEKHYRGDVPQLTARAVIMGCLLGGVMSLSNLYVGLKTGWGIGVAITACILSFSLGAGLKKAGVLRTNLSLLENNCMQSTASSAGYSTGGTMVGGIAALAMITGQHIPYWTLTIWTVLLAALGVLMAIPMKRQMINVEQLSFPSGIAAAETLRSLYARGGEAIRKSRSLGLAAAFGVLVSFGRDNSFSWWPGSLRIHGMLEIPGSLAGHSLARWTVSLEPGLIMIAAGAIIGLKVASSMLLGGILNYLVLAPAMYRHGAITELGYAGIVSWSLWGGTAIMVTSGLLSFLFQWRTVLRALFGIAGLVNRESGDANGSRSESMDRIEVPGSWFNSGVIVVTTGIVIVQVISFSIHWWMGLLSVFMAFFLAIVACRATGETDVTPIGALGKITQLFYGMAAPANITTNLMTACVTAGSAASAADLLTDLKSGYLLGANPRKQFIAQFIGIFAGAAAVVPGFYLLVPDPSILGGDMFPAPSAQVWKGVAELLANGLSSLHPSARIALLVGGSLGLVIPVLERKLPEKLRLYVPSAMGLGLSCVIPFWNTASIFIGAMAAWALTASAPKAARRYIIPVASGAIAGESLTGVFIAVAGALGFS